MTLSLSAPLESFLKAVDEPEQDVETIAETSQLLQSREVYPQVAIVAKCAAICHAL